ncbi:MAG: imelysin family protein [Pseudomonadota bacterium]
MPRFVLILISLLSLTSVSTGQSVQPDALGRQIVSGHIVPGYARLATHTLSLKQAVDAACGDGGTWANDGLKQEFKKVLSAWMQVQHIRFGPAMAEDRFHRMAFWPDKHGRGPKQQRRVLNRSIDKVPGTDRIGRTSVALQGLPSLERLIYPPRPWKEQQMVKVCKLARAIGHNLAAIAKGGHTAWKEFKHSGEQPLVELMVRNLVEHLTIITDLKLARPMGRSTERARPSGGESWRSRQSLANIGNNMKGLQALLSGGDGAPGLTSAIPDAGETAGIGNAIHEHLRFGIATLESYELSLYDAVASETGREKLRFLIAHTEGLKELVLLHVAPALGVNLGFNSQDGD